MKNASIYAKVRGGVTVVRVLIRPADSDFQWRAGAATRLRYVRDVICTHAGRQVFSARMDRWMPADPSFEFRIRSARAGETLRLSWRDNLGTAHSIESVIL